jgi:hypothetical protein
MKQWVDITHLMAEYCEKPFFLDDFPIEHGCFLAGYLGWIDD